jgi:FMN phosphatase YigB (HAD superfamily)
MDNQRWATFDCYGTLVDWNAGIRAELGRLFGASASDGFLARYHVLEPRETVETHIRNIFAKLGAGSRVEVARIVERADRLSGTRT